MVAEFETLLEYVGGFGAWQQRLLVFMSLNMMFQGFQNLGSVFLAATPDHWCHVPGLADNLNWTDEAKDFVFPKEVRQGKKGYTKCYYYDRDYADLFNYSTDLTTHSLITANQTAVPIVPCKDWIFDKSLYASTIVSEWNLVCSSRWLMSSVQATYMAGVLVGCLIFGFASDRWGRRKAMIVAQVIFCFSSIATAFAPHYLAFVFGRFFIAVAAPGVSGCGFCLSRCLYLQH
uniref:Major facilitator superfamily (MFS) profile domain-containing protein n=1 Tax=Strigamia maritima TaxID=126957 RepID=T1IKQ9_STRMM